MLQEQERAFYRSRSDGVLEPDRFAASPSPDAGASDADPEDEEDADPSLALARALMEEEHREWRNRMFALAGVGDPDDDEDEGVDVDGMTYEELTELGETIGSRSRGVSAAAMATVRQFTYSSRVNPEPTDAEEVEECAVCRFRFEDRELCLALPKCGHEYHAECLKPWLAENNRCPLCKAEIEEDGNADFPETPGAVVRSL